MRRRLNKQLADEATLMQSVIVSTKDKRANKKFQKRIKELVDGN